MSERIQQLKERLHYKSSVAWGSEHGHFKSDASIIPHLRPETKLCLERTRLVTKSYQASEGEPTPIRRAKALKHVLENMTIYIDEGELIVGNFASDRKSLPIYPECVHRWVKKALNNGYKDLLTDEGKKEYMEMDGYWQQRSFTDKVIAAVPKNLRPYIFYNGANSADHFAGWRAAEILNIEKVLKLGLKGLISQIDNRIEELETNVIGMPAQDYIEQRNNLEAMRISLQAAIDFAKRYATLAQEMAKEEENEKRREELLKIAEVCERVPQNPARTLHEAIQSYFFCNLIAKAIEINGQGAGDRVDVLFNPYYQKDKAEGKTTRQEAIELIECLHLKMAERGHLNDPEGMTYYEGLA